MSIYVFLFFLLSLSTAQDDCTPKTCSDHGPPIRFPFRLKNHHPQHCGYPGFDLSCSPNNTATVLDLPNSVKVLVTHIDYKSRLIHIKDSNSCFPQQLQNLHLSTTPFQFADTVYTFSLFSCPLAKPGFSYRATCFVGDGSEVYAEYGEESVSYAYVPPPMLSCRKMYNLSVPIEAFHQAHDLQLKWPRRVCDLKCETEDRGEELGIHIQDEGDAKIAKKLAIVGLWCIQWYPVDRPSMHGVIQMLDGDGDALIKPPNPFASTNPTLAIGQSSGRPFNNELEVIVESE